LRQLFVACGGFFVVTQGFTRQEVMALTGLKSGRLSYFDRTGLVQPEKIGDLKHPVVLYTWEQLLELRAIVKLGEQLSLQQIRQVLKVLQEQGYSKQLFDKPLLFINSSLCIETGKNELGERLVSEVLGKHKGQLVFQWVAPLGELIQEIKEEAQKNPAINRESFEKRAKFAKTA
jgi:DNA-binding transcriptional MerR regulator